jgi:NCAIR mutase (PurE)-related protein
MTPVALQELLARLQRGEVDIAEVVRACQAAPTLDLGFATLDTQRELRKGFPEVVYGAGKTPDQLQAIVARLFEVHGRVLATRVDESHVSRLRHDFPQAIHHSHARCITVETHPPKASGHRIGVVCAGTSDLPVAEEAAVTLRFLGHQVESIHDVGVAGLHRLLARLPDLQRMRVVLCVAGMEGALPSVLGGLLPQPIIAVPTSVGYGTHFHGLTPLLAMLNSCASGLTVVNIDNGFGAAVAAHAIVSLPPVS